MSGGGETMSVALDSLSKEIQELRRAIHQNQQSVVGRCHPFDWNLMQSLTDLSIRVEDLKGAVKDEGDKDEKEKNVRAQARRNDCGGFTTRSNKNYSNDVSNVSNVSKKSMTEKYEYISRHLHQIRESLE